MLRKFFALIILFSSISAHPVIFKNGKVIWLTQNPSFNDVRFGVSKSSNWLIGGRFLGEATLLRFYVLHCIGLPFIIMIFMAVHFWRIRKDGGISTPV